MMESSSLENWDGRHSKSEQKNAQNIAIGGLKTLKDQSNLPANSSEIFEVINDVSMVGPASSGEARNLAGIEGSRNFTNTTSIIGLQEEQLSQIMGPSSLMNVSALTTPITPRKQALNASNDDSSTTRKFLPADSPLLKCFHQPNASSSNAELAQRLEAAISGNPLPRAKNIDDAISLHSADAEGEDEDEDDDIYVAKSLLSFSPLKAKERSDTDVRPTSPSDHNSLFTPPPSYPSAEFLFTPPPLAKDVASTSKTRIIMSHVEVPPCPYPKSAYKLLPSRLFEKKSRPPAQPVQVHMSLGEALQASLEHNDAIGVMGKANGQPKKKKDRQDTHEKPRKTIAGLSKPSIASESSSISKNAHSNISNKKKRISGGEQLKDSTKQKKVDIDLTLSDNELSVTHKPKKNIAPKPKPLPKRKSEDRKHVNYQTIVIGVVKPVAADVRALNTRFVRNKMEKSAIPPPHLKKTRKTFSPRKTPGFLPLSSPQSEDDDVSLGDPIPTSWRNDPDEVSDDDDVPIILQINQSEVKQHSPPLSAPPTAPKRVVSRKIDLAALYRNKAKTGSTKSAKSPTNLKNSVANPPVLEPSISSLSQPPPSPKNSSSHLDREDDEAEPVIPITPSAKALGKRKAISPPPFSVPSQTPSHDEFLPGAVINQELGHFINNDSFSPPEPQPYANGVAMSSGFSPSIQPSLFPVYQSESSFGLASENFHAMTEDDQFGFQAQQAPFWASLENVNPEYEYTTVDPTLLGGAPVYEEPSEPDDNGNYEDSYSGFVNTSEDGSDSESFPVAGPSVIRTRSSTSRSSHSSASSSQEYAPPKERSPSVSSSSNSASRSEVVDNPPIAPILRKPSPMRPSPSPFVDEQKQDRSGSEYMPSPPSSKHHIHKPRQASSPFSYDPGIVSEKEYAPSTASSYEPSSVGERKRKQPEPLSEPVRTLPKRQRVEPHRADMVSHDAYLEGTESETSNTGKASAPKRTKSIWPTCGIFSYCHQCRRRTDISKMLCVGCNAIYCCRCFTTRYTSEQFVETTDDCPRCKSYCNCTNCCARRGEKYISMRKPMLASQSMEMAGTVARPSATAKPKTTARPKPTAVPKTMAVPSRTTTTTPSRPVNPGDMQYFGTLYDLNGRRIAATFAPSGGEGSTPSVLFTKESGNQLPNSQISTRIYVGKLQRSWGLGKDVNIKEIKPMARPKKAPKDGTIRRFVGRPDFVKFPRPRPGEEDDMSDDLSSLTSLTDSEEEPGDRDDVETFNPHSLGDSDVSLAIILALNASGLMITPSHSA